MVGAGEQELDAAGKGAEFADDQPVVVDGIVVKDVVLFKQAGVVYKIIVHSKVPDGDVGVGDGGFQIDGLAVAGAGIKDIGNGFHAGFLLEWLCERREGKAGIAATVRSLHASVAGYWLCMEECFVALEQRYHFFLFWMVPV